MTQLYFLALSFKKKSKYLISVFIVGLLFCNTVEGQINITAVPSSYSEGFSAYVGTAASLPPGWTSSSAFFNGIGTGTNNTGGCYAFGTGGEYALGVLRSNSRGDITHTVSFVNTSPTTINQITLSWNYEQWRFANTSGLDCSGTGALAGNATLNAKDFTGAATGTAGATTVVASFTMTGLNIPTGTSFGISWLTTDVVNSDNGVAIDDFSMDVASTCSSPVISSQAAPLTQSVCQNLAPTNLTIATAAGATLPVTYQWYSNTISSNSGGTSVGSANGGQTTSYTPPTSISGSQYYYCVVNGCSINTASQPVAVNVTIPPSASISYPGTPFCSNTGIVNVTRTGTAGGVYSAGPAGLSINAGTGDINTALSTAGTYTVTYTMAAIGGCTQQTATTSVTINALPAATISYPTTAFCKIAGTQNVTRTGTAGGTYTASPTGLSINGGTGTITPSASTEGSYTVTYTMIPAAGSGCTGNQTATATVTIASTITSIAPAAVQDLSVNNDGTTLTVSEGGVTVSRQWKYGLNPAGPFTNNLGTAATQVPNFPTTGIYYIVCESTYPASPCGGATVISNVVQINVTNNVIVTTPALYGPFCNNSNNPVTVNFTYSPAINFTAGTAVFTAQLSDGSGSFASPVNIGAVVSNASGSQTITAVIPSGVTGGTGCRIRVRSSSPTNIGTDNDNDIIIGNFGSLNIVYSGSPFCNTTSLQTVTRTGPSGGTYSSTSGLTIDPGNGSINPSTSTAGTYIITYTVPATGSCPVQTATTNVTVTALPAATISYPASPFCSNGTVQVVTLTGTPGGTYSSTPGLSINTSTGAVTPLSSTVGTYIVTYTMAPAGGCPVQTDAASVTITQAPVASISYSGSPFCSNDFTTKSVTRTGTIGGTYTAVPAGLSINASTGDIAIFSSAPGTYTVTYSMNAVGGCPVQTATTTVIINTAPVVSDVVAIPGTTITLPGTVNVSDITTGGTWSSSNTGIATVNGTGLVTGVANGTAIIKYTVTSGGCSTIASTAINVLTPGGVGIWTNPITGTNPSSTNPYTAGQVVSSNLSVSGIGYTGVSSNVANDRFNTTNWDVSATVNTGKYIYFTLTPDAGYAIDFTSFVYTGQASGSGPNALTIRSSKDGYGSDMGSPTIAGTSISLTAAPYQNITSPITFRVYGTGATATNGTFSINDFTFYGNMRVLCPSPSSIEFVAQPSFVPQNVVMSPVLVRAKCSDGTTGAAYSGSVVLSVFNGCGYVTQTVNAVGGIATFNNISFTRSAQSNVKLQAFASGFTSVLSDTFSITAPGGTAATTILATENFEGASTWVYTSSSDVVVGSGGTSGTGFIGIRTFSGNKSLVKSYSVDNNSGKLGSKNTITFANQPIASSYNHATFNFKVASLGTGAVGSGAGHDNGEQMLIEISLDGGTLWSKLLTYSGSSDYLFPFSGAPLETLAYNANASYVSPSTLSAFTVPLPSGATQFRFRLTASNNRTNENWGIDDISLVGTSVASATVTNGLPTVINDNITSCPNSNTTITLVTTNTVGVVSYVWSPATFISNASISNPVVNPPAAAVYTANITDAEGCKASGTFTIAVPGGTLGTWYGTNNSDWFQCGNWGLGTIPDNSTTVTIPNVALNTADIDPLSTYAVASRGIARANNLTIDNKILRLQANANLNVAGNLTIQNVGTLDMTNGGQVDLNGSWSKITGAIFMAGTGTINYTGSSSQTVAAEDYYNLVSSSTGNRTMASTGTVGVAGSFTKGGNTYTFTGSTVNYNGSGAQNITPFTAGGSVGATYNNLTLSNTGIKSLTGATDVEADLSLNNNIQLALGNNFLTLKSTAANTARVAPVSSSATLTYGSGRFVIERYYPGGRSWRLITAPVTVDATKSFFNSWQVGGNNSLTGSGTYITGPAESSTNGLDFSPAHNYSLKSFNQVSSGFDGVPNTKTKLISGTAGVAGVPDNVGYFMFVRGDRTPANADAFNPNGTVLSTTLRDTGKIQIQSYIFPANPSISANKYTLIGNPYASPVDFTNVIKNNVANKFWAWDPKLNAVGGYAIVDLALGTVTTVPSGGATTQTQIIQSKQAFIVETTNISPSPVVTFNETSKSSSNNLSLFRPVPNSSVGSLALNLEIINPDGTVDIADGVLAQFNDQFSNGLDILDGLKFTNLNETFGIMSGGNFLMLERRRPLQVNDTIFLKLTKSGHSKYRFDFIAERIVKNNLAGFLEDNFLRTSTPLNMEGNTLVDFDVRTDAASKAPDRFRIVFRQSAIYTNVEAKIDNHNILVSWNVNNENNIDYYEVERSVDSIHFTAVNNQVANANNNQTAAYNWIDIDPLPGIYYYRIKSTSKNGVIGYSEIVKILLPSKGQYMYVFPNPVTENVIQLQFNNKAAGIYEIRLMNNLGQTLITKHLNHVGGSSTQKIIIPGTLVNGVYDLQIILPGSKVNVIKVLLDKKQ